MFWSSPTGHFPKTIVDKEADYLLALKGNQQKLHDAVKNALREVTMETHAVNVTIGQGHGRTECREYHVLPADTIKKDFPEWPELKTIGVAIGYRLEKGGKESLQYRYYISSAKLRRDIYCRV